MASEKRTVLVYAHRGASAKLPENTLEAFELAVEAGVDAIETDVHLTSDGIPVLAHDPSGRREAQEKANVVESSLAQVKRWDVGRVWKKRHPEESRVFRIPTLEEALEAFPTMRFNIDVKQNDRRAAMAVVETLDRLDAWKRVCVASFHDAMTEVVRQVAPQAETSLGQRGAQWLALAPRWLIDRKPLQAARAQLPTHAGPLRFDTPRFLDKARGLGLAVDFWVINDPDEARALAALGVDGVMTDDPETIVPAVREGDKTRDL